MRGFNQALVLAQIVGAQPGFPVQPHNLRRTRSTDSQGERGARGRHRSVAGAFSVQNSNALEGKHLILVDDVITSWATVRAAACTLKKAGAASVLVLAAARVLSK